MGGWLHRCAGAELDLLPSCLSPGNKEAPGLAWAYKVPSTPPVLMCVSFRGSGCVALLSLLFQGFGDILCSEVRVKVRKMCVQPLPGFVVLVCR